LLLLLAACQPDTSDPNPLNATASAVANAETVADASTALASLPTAETPTILTSDATATPCAFVWATRPQIELTARVNQVLLDAGLRGIEASASSYGETCGAAFLAMDTSFDFFIPTEAGGSDEALGTLAAQLIALVRDIPLAERPAPNRGYFTLLVVGGAEERTIRVREDDALAALVAHPAGGAALLDALLAAGVRRAHRAVPDDPAEDRRYEDAHRGEPPAHLQRLRGESAL
jgi:hypothetical protein